MNFHIVHKNAQKGIARAMDAIRADGGAKLMTVGALRAHCRAASPANADPNFHAALCFLQSPHVSLALKRYRAESGNKNFDMAERRFMQAINASRSALPDDDESLYAKGLIRTPAGYHIAPESLAYGSDYDATRRKLYPDAAEILFHATGWAIGRNRHSADIPVGSKTLHYIAVQLLPESDDKKFKINKLSLDVNPQRHAHYMTQSARAINLLAAELGIAFSKQVPPPREGVQKIWLEGERRPGPPALVFDRHKNDLAAKALYADLKRNVASGSISRGEARIYRAHKGGRRTFNDIADDYDLDATRIEHIVRKVETVLLHANKPQGAF